MEIYERLIYIHIQSKSNKWIVENWEADSKGQVEPTYSWRKELS